jgi:hypothetical protein
MVFSEADRPILKHFFKMKASKRFMMRFKDDSAALTTPG